MAKKKASNTASGGGSPLGFEATLWAAADKLRNNMDAAEYKHVVLGLIFLKYISDSFEELHRKLIAGEGEFEGADPEDQDEYKAQNVFWVPAEARWQHLQDNAKQPTIGKLVDDAMVAIERDNTRLKGILPKDYARPAGWLLVWDATFTATEQDLVFGDQEEMGFGARIASECTEMKGGTLLGSHGVKTAKETWGKPAAWCDYSGTKDGQPIGITLMAGPQNFRESWWHNRDYGVFVANAFGRAAMKQGAASTVPVKPGESLRIVYGAMLHDGKDYAPASEYKSFLETVK